MSATANISAMSGFIIAPLTLVINVSIDMGIGNTWRRNLQEEVSPPDYLQIILRRYARRNTRGWESPNALYTKDICNKCEAK